MTVEQIVTVLSSMNLIRTAKISGDYYQIYCPIHSDGNERKPSCGILLHDQYRGGRRYVAGFCHCFACGYAKSLPDLITDLLKRHNISQTGIEWLSENIPGFYAEQDLSMLLPPDLVEELSSNLALDFFKRMKSTTKTYVSEEELASYRFTVPYMYERKMTDEAIERFDVGFDPNYIPPGRKNPLPCITLPVRDSQGRTLFICRRSIEGKFFSYPEGVIKPVYGLDLIPSGCKSLVIVESCINAITCYTYGYTAVALLGTGDDYQLQQLRNLGIHEFVICLDNDPAGMKGVTRLKKGLSDVAILWTMIMPEGRDVNDCSKAEFDQIYMNKQ